MNTYQVKKLKKFIHDTQDYNLELSEEVKQILHRHYHNGDLNQYFLIIIKHVLSDSQVNGDTHNLILGLMVRYSELDYSGIKMNTVEQVFDFAVTTYKFMMKHLLIVQSFDLYAERF